MYIDTRYGDRRMTADGRGLVTLASGPKSKQPRFLHAAWLTPLGARQLIDTLEPFAAPRAEPAPPVPTLVGTEWLAGADPTSSRGYVVQFRTSFGWCRSGRCGMNQTFASKTEALKRLGGLGIQDRPDYRVVAVDV